MGLQIPILKASGLQIPMNGGDYQSFIHPEEVDYQSFIFHLFKTFILHKSYLIDFSNLLAGLGYKLHPYL